MKTVVNKAYKYRLYQFCLKKLVANKKKVNKDLKLADRTWTCKTCGATHDRESWQAKISKSLQYKHVKIKYGRNCPN